MNKQLIKKFKKYDDTFVNRPLGKPDETVRGRLLKWNGSDYVAFEPQKSKDNTRPYCNKGTERRYLLSQ